MPPGRGGVRALNTTTYAAALTIPDGQHQALCRIANTT
jgi:hypothetical protein